MALISTFTVPNACGCCPDDGPYLVVGRCESLTGTAALCGYSGFSADAAPYDPDAPEDWEGQFLKWGTKTYAGEAISLCCSGASGSPDARGRGYRGSGVYADDCTFSSTVERRVFVDSGCTSYSWGSWTSYLSDVLQPPDAETGSSSDWTEAHTLTLHSFVGPEICSDTSSQIRSGTITAELSDERFFWDSLNALFLSGLGDVVAAHLCCATTSAADLTSPESTDPLSLTGTAVAAAVTVHNCGPVGTPVDVYMQLESDGITTVVLHQRPRILCGIPGRVLVPQPHPGDPAVCLRAVALDPSGPWVPVRGEV